MKQRGMWRFGGACTTPAAPPTDSCSMQLVRCHGLNCRRIKWANYIEKGKKGKEMEYCSDGLTFTAVNDQS